jgi:hypothetical protein
MVNLSTYLEKSDKNISIEIDMEATDSIPFNISIDDGWYDLQGINSVIKELQKVKRILQTRQIKEGD